MNTNNRNPQRELTPEELDAQVGVELPPREALSLVGPAQLRPIALEPNLPTAPIESPDIKGGPAPA